MARQYFVFVVYANNEDPDPRGCASTQADLRLRCLPTEYSRTSVARTQMARLP